MWARIEDAAVAEVTDIDPQDRFHPSLIWVPCPHHVVSGMDYVNGTFTLPPKAPIDHAAQIAARRYQQETAGITVDGVRVATDRDSQSMITAAALSALIDPTYACSWKALNGVFELSAAQLIGQAKAVRAHVQASFDRECELLAALALGTYTADWLDQGWPAS
ncbi:DUF4376 domain-containing protein [Pseudomonas prosekii]|uniref:DUF4376 domain-containing protein n=1 Tax=Pseudomonas prosekii TaxID=1148509 RepID=UPI00387B3F84